MSNNISISTSFQKGTGIIYPAECPREFVKDTNSQSYLVLIPRHLLVNLTDEINSSVQDYKSYFRFEIYDKKNKLVEQEKIEKVFVFKNDEQHTNPLLDDIACLLIFLNKSIKLSLKMRIHRGEIENRSELTLTGYPYVMSEIKYATKVELKSIYKKIVPKSDKVGILHIIDDYHWYNDRKDLSLFEGFSGGTVCYNEALYGMNQSLTSLEEGENPFKLVFFLRIEYMIEYLRNAGCLVYYVERDGSYKIKWIYKENVATNQATAILLGGSGSGKSSFAKSFSSHGSLIDATNDGQTTRNNIIYQFKTYENNPRVEIKLLNQENFLNRMYEVNFRNILISLLEIFFGKLKDNIESNLIEKYVYNLSPFFKELEKKEILRTGTIEKLMYDTSDNVRNEILGYILNILFKKMDISQLPFIMNGANFTSFLENVNLEDDENECRKLLEEIWRLPCSKEVASLIFSLLPRDQKEIFNFEKLQIDAAGLLNYKEDKQETFEEFLKKKSDFLERFLTIDGFLDLTEFPFLGETIEERIENKHKLKYNLEIEQSKHSSESIGSIFEDIYRKIYNFLSPKLLVFLRLNRVQDPKIITLKQQISTDEKDSITLALQVKGGNSISSLVNQIYIFDSIASNYSYLFDKLEIDKLKLIDTHGLDHANWDLSTKSLLKKMIFKFNEDGIVEFDNKLSVFYIKKLDSGRPNELKNILPIIHDFIPQAAIYTVFTGADIFYQNQFDQLIDIDWRNPKGYIPKNISYLFSENGKKELQSRMSSRSQRKDNLYMTLVNNLVIYTNNGELIQKNYDAYASNYSQIYNLLNSMISKEYSSLGVVHGQVLNNLRTDESKEQIKVLLKKVFKKASVTNWKKYHHATGKANSVRLLNEREKNDEMKGKKNIKSTLGFSRTHNHFWYQLFHEGYVQTMTSHKVEKLLDSLNPGGMIQKNALSSSIVSMEQKFLGKPESLKDKEITNDKKSIFRELLEQMYSEEEQEILFKTVDGLIVDSNLKEDRELRYQMLNTYFDFGKKFEENEKNQSMVLDDLVNHFIKTLEMQIIEDNKVKSKNLMHINADFLESLASMEKKYMEKYQIAEMREETVRAEFYTLLNYFFDIKRER